MFCVSSSVPSGSEASITASDFGSSACSITRVALSHTLSNGLVPSGSSCSADGSSTGCSRDAIKSSAGWNSRAIKSGSSSGSKNGSVSRGSAGFSSCSISPSWANSCAKTLSCSSKGLVSSSGPFSPAMASCSSTSAWVCSAARNKAERSSFPCHAGIISSVTGAALPTGWVRSDSGMSRVFRGSVFGSSWGVEWDSSISMPRLFISSSKLVPLPLDASEPASRMISSTS